MRNACFLMVSLCLTACDGKGSFTPQEGVWERGESTATDGCYFGFGTQEASSDDTGGADLATLTMNDDGDGFTLDIDGPGEDLTCWLDGQDYSCDLPSSVESETGTHSYENEGISAEVTTEATMGGQFASTTSGTFVMEVSASCAGADCEALADHVGGEFPCTSTETWPITAR